MLGFYLVLNCRYLPSIDKAGVHKSILNDTNRDKFQNEISFFIASFGAEIQELRRNEAIQIVEMHINSTTSRHRFVLLSLLFIHILFSLSFFRDEVLSFLAEV